MNAFSPPEINWPKVADPALLQMRLGNGLGDRRSRAVWRSLNSKSAIPCAV